MTVQVNVREWHNNYMLDDDRLTAQVNVPEWLNNYMSDDDRVTVQVNGRLQTDFDFLPPPFPPV